LADLFPSVRSESTRIIVPRTLLGVLEARASWRIRGQSRSDTLGGLLGTAGGAGEMSVGWIADRTPGSSILGEKVT
jgi:hypothetical protein